MPKLQRLSAVTLILTLMVLMTPASLPTVEAAHARKRPTAKSSSSNAYDKQITTFDTSGQLLQLQYAQRAADRGSAGLFLHCLPLRHGCGGEDEVIIAVVANDRSDIIINNNRNYSMFRIHNGIMAKITGLQGDARLLARHLLSESHSIHWSNGGCTSASTASNQSEKVDMDIDTNLEVDVRQIANTCAEVQHSLTIRSGARPLAAQAIMFGISNSNTDDSYFGSGSTYKPKLGLFQCHISGTVDQCHFCSVGTNARDGTGKDRDYVRELETIFEQIMAKDGRELDNSSRKEEKSVGSNSDEEEQVDVSNVIAKVAELLLKGDGTYPHSKGGSKSEATVAATPAVDIYVMKPNSKCRGGVQISCATCVSKDDLNDVATLLTEDLKS